MKKWLFLALIPGISCCGVATTYAMDASEEPFADAEDAAEAARDVPMHGLQLRLLAALPVESLYGGRVVGTIKWDVVFSLARRGFIGNDRRVMLRVIHYAFTALSQEAFVPGLLRQGEEQALNFFWGALAIARCGAREVPPLNCRPDSDVMQAVRENAFELASALVLRRHEFKLPEAAEPELTRWLCELQSNALCCMSTILGVQAQVFVEILAGREGSCDSLVDAVCASRWHEKTKIKERRDAYSRHMFALTHLVKNIDRITPQKRDFLLRQAAQSCLPEQQILAESKNGISQKGLEVFQTLFSLGSGFEEAVCWIEGQVSAGVFVMRHMLSCLGCSCNIKINYLHLNRCASVLIAW